MEKLLLNDGAVIDAIGFGTYKVTEELTEGKTKEIVLNALSLGYRYIDTAAFYQNEAEIGEALQICGIDRKMLFIATKVWKDNLGYEKTKESIENSLKKLKLSYIDLLLIHWPKEFPEDPEWKEKIQGSYKAMEEAVQEGKVKHLGLSNFYPHHIMAVMEKAKIKPVLNQLELHVGFMQEYTVSYCKSQGILLQAWSPLGRMRVTAHPTIVKMAEKYHVTVTDLLLRFLLQNGFSVIPKATKEEHMKANLNPTYFMISEEDFSILSTMPRIGWGGEHPDFTREEVDFRYQS